MKPYRILLINAGYCTGIGGKLREYALKSYRYLYCPKRIEQKAINALKQLIRRQKPDIVCIVEIKKQQAEQLVNKQYPFVDAEVKYGKKSILRKLPVARKNCNAILAKMPMRTKKVFLASGAKKLAYLVSLPHNMTLILCHCSLGESSRKKQLDEISRLVRHQKKTVVCSDFNARDLNEFDSFCASTKLRRVPSAPTFPACKPRWTFDCFFCPPGIHAKARVIPHRISDHLAVMADVRW